MRLTVGAVNLKPTHQTWLLQTQATFGAEIRQSKSREIIMSQYRLLWGAFAAQFPADASRMSDNPSRPAKGLEKEWLDGVRGKVSCK